MLSSHPKYFQIVNSSIPVLCFVSKEKNESHVHVTMPKQASTTKGMTGVVLEEGKMFRVTIDLETEMDVQKGKQYDKHIVQETQVKSLRNRNIVQVAPRGGQGGQKTIVLDIKLPRPVIMYEGEKMNRMQIERYPLRIENVLNDFRNGVSWDFFAFKLLWVPKKKEMGN